MISHYNDLTEESSRATSAEAELKKSVSDGKSTVASAITAKGVSTASDATFVTMATNIKNIPNVNSGTYTPSSNGSALDMGATNTYRYVNTNTVYNNGYNAGKTSVTVKASIGEVNYSGGYSTGSTFVLVSWTLNGMAHATYYTQTGNTGYGGTLITSNSYWQIVSITKNTFQFKVLKPCVAIKTNGSTSTISAGTTIGYQYYQNGDTTYTWY